MTSVPIYRYAHAVIRCGRMTNGIRCFASPKKSTLKNSWRGSAASGSIRRHGVGDTAGTFQGNQSSDFIERFEMPSKQDMREESERLIREAMERKSVTVKQGDTRINAVCGKCGAPNRVLAAPGQLRAPFTCKECGHEQKTF
jgi:hypothetical protein